MSIELHVSLIRSTLPTRERWQVAISAAGFDLRLDDFDWETQAGYLPVRLNDEATGFEVEVGPLSNEVVPSGQSLPKAHDAIVSFKFSEDLTECKAATCAAAALAQCAKGLYFDDYTDEPLTGDVAVALARDTLTEN